MWNVKKHISGGIALLDFANYNELLMRHQKRWNRIGYNRVTGIINTYHPFCMYVRRTHGQY